MFRDNDVKKYNPEDDKYKPRKEKNLIPPYQKKSVSSSWLSKNPKYRELFHRCPSCDLFSFVNVDNYARKIKGRKCRNCGFTNESVE